MAEQTGLLSRVEAVRARAKKKFSTFERHLEGCTDHIDSQITSCQENLTAWQTEQSRLAEQATELQQRADELDRQREAMSDSRTMLATRLRRRLQSLRDKTQQVQEASEQSHSLQADVDKANAQAQALEKQLAEQQARHQNEQADSERVREELTALRVDEKQLRKQLAEGKKLLNERARQLQEARQQVDNLTRKNNDNQAQTDELVELRRVRDRLTDELSELKSKIETQQRSDPSQEEVDDLQRKFEMAVESLRSVKSRNEELTGELNQLRQSQVATTTNSPASIEQQVLNQLGALGAEDAATDVEARPDESAKNALTDKLLTEKDERIAKLEAALEQSRQASPQAPVADNFERAQQEWLEKQRAAEVELAVARAQNARTRNELEEKMRDLEAELALARKRRTASTSASESSQKRGWLSNLRRRDDE